MFRLALERRIAETPPGRVHHEPVGCGPTDVMPGARPRPVEGCRRGTRTNRCLLDHQDASLKIVLCIDRGGLEPTGPQRPGASMPPMVQRNESPVQALHESAEVSGLARRDEHQGPVVHQSVGVDGERVFDGEFAQGGEVVEPVGVVDEYRLGTAPLNHQMRLTGHRQTCHSGHG